MYGLLGKWGRGIVNTVFTTSQLSETVLENLDNISKPTNGRIDDGTKLTDSREVCSVKDNLVTFAGNNEFEAKFSTVQASIDMDDYTDIDMCDGYRVDLSDGSSEAGEPRTFVVEAQVHQHEDRKVKGTL